MTGRTHKRRKVQSKASANTGSWSAVGTKVVVDEEGLAHGDEEMKKKQQQSKAEKEEKERLQKEKELQRERLGKHELLRLTDPKHFSRLLYTNPVCMLTTRVCKALRAEEPTRGTHNAMIISWLSPINNDGGVMLSMNKARFSAKCLEEQKVFVLNVPTSDMSDLVLNVGKYSGGHKDKFASLPELVPVPLGHCTKPESAAGASAASAKGQKGKSLAAMANPFALLDGAGEGSDGEGKDEEASKGKGEDKKGKKEGADAAEAGAEAAADDGEEALPLIGIAGCVAQMHCRVRRMDDADEHHHLIVADIVEAWVHPDYWNGKHFLPTKDGLAPYLTFLGSQKFAHVTV